MLPRASYIINIACCIFFLLLPLFAFISKEMVFRNSDIKATIIFILVFLPMIILDVFGLKLQRANERAVLTSGGFRSAGIIFFVLSLLAFCAMTFGYCIFSAQIVPELDSVDMFTMIIGYVILILGALCIISNLVNFWSFIGGLRKNKNIYLKDAEMIGQDVRQV